MANIQWKQVSSDKPKPNTKILIKATITQYNSWNEVKFGERQCEMVSDKAYEKVFEAYLTEVFNDNATLTDVTPLWKLFKGQDGVFAFEYDKVTEWAEWFPEWSTPTE